MTAADEPLDGFGELCDVLVPLAGGRPASQQLAQGVQLGPCDRFRLLGPVPSGQTWLFQPGEIVRCNIKVLSQTEAHWQALEPYPA